MGLFGLFRPKWQSKNPEVRLAAVQAMAADAADTLQNLATTDPDPRVRLAAVQRLPNRSALEELLAHNPAPEVQREIHKRLQPLLGAALLAGAPGEDAATLLVRIEDSGLLTRLAVEAPTPALRIAAVQRLDDQEALCTVVEQHCGKGPGQAALERIADPALLERIARSAASKVIRRLAEEKLAAANPLAPPSPVDTPATDAYAPLLAAACELSATDAGAGGQQFAALEQAWVQLDPHRAEPRWTAFVAARARFETACAAAEASGRAQEAVLTTLEQLAASGGEDAPQRFQTAQERWAALGGEPLAARYSEACRRFTERQEVLADEQRRLTGWEVQLDALAPETAGSDALPAADRALGELAAQLEAVEFQCCDPGPLLARIAAARTAGATQRAAHAAAQASAAVEQRETLCAELEALVTAEDRTAAGKRAKALPGEWKRLPALADKPQARALEERFRAAREQFRISQGPYLEQLEWQRWANRTQQETLCAEVEALDAVEDLATVAEQVKQAHKRWKEIGPVPRAVAEALWQRFKTACDRNFERCQPYFEEQAQQRAAALEHREELCRQAEEHAESSAWKESADALKALQAAWKEAGAVPRKKDQALYARFRTACDRFFARRQEHFAALDAQRGGNQREKEKLCARAEALANTPLREYVKEFRDLQAEWKRAGPAPRAAENALWERFRGACDRFFAWLDEGRLDNLRQKEALCEEVETLVAGATDDADPRVMAGQIAQLQKRWEEIGPVPQEQSDGLWARFRKPCDAFFAARQEQFAQLEAERRANEEQKLELLHQAEELVDDGDSKAAAEPLKELQQAWNNLGPATREREPELRERFTSLCDAFFAGRRQQFADQAAARLENLKRKEALCVQLERVVGTVADAVGTGENTALSLAEQLQLAFAANFALAGDQNTPERRLEEVRRIQEEWREIGPVPREQDQTLWARYRALLDAFQGDRPRGEREA